MFRNCLKGYQNILKVFNNPVRFFRFFLDILKVSRILYTIFLIFILVSMILYFVFFFNQLKLYYKIVLQLFNQKDYSNLKIIFNPSCFFSALLYIKNYFFRDRLKCVLLFFCACAEIEQSISWYGSTATTLRHVITPTPSAHPING